MCPLRMGTQFSWRICWQVSWVCRRQIKRRLCKRQDARGRRSTWLRRSTGIGVPGVVALAKRTWARVCRVFEQKLVVADEYNNSLLIFASSVDFQRLEATLKQLDVMATQVLIEASIIEVTLTDGFEFGLEWAFDNYLGGGDFGSALSIWVVDYSPKSRAFLTRSLAVPVPSKPW